ncbi:hypothetical protein PVAP13_1NG115838 [Panicum virgatum]|uniref:Uncharacterized protein n=1 Tax=Panicum virgatum TaxID=38727 RepID=A0A8T0WKN2_PANVG|nr:hypothetical protein PVAP13_1NG115838 [Panicum virgatum]
MGGLRPGAFDTDGGACGRAYEEASRAVSMCAASLLFASLGPTVARLPSVRCPHGRVASSSSKPSSPAARSLPFTSLPPGHSPVRTPTPPRFPNPKPKSPI